MHKCTTVDEMADGTQFDISLQSLKQTLNCHNNCDIIMQSKHKNTHKSKVPAEDK